MITPILTTSRQREELADELDAAAEAMAERAESYQDGGWFFTAHHLRAISRQMQDTAHRERDHARR